MGPTRRCRSTYSRQPEPKPATGELEPSERHMRARGRAGDDLGSSRSSRDDDIPPQMYDEGVPHASEETNPHVSQEGAGGSTSSTTSIPYKRGPSQLPK
jgi:hypothetical protein